LGRRDIEFKLLAELFVPTTAMANETVQQVANSWLGGGRISEEVRCPPGSVNVA
jgi:hypothetical protein